MDSSENFEINYWGKDFSYIPQQKKGKSLKKKFMIISLFIILLAVSPSIIFNLKNLQQSQKKEISSTAPISVIPKKISPTPTKTPNEGIVAKNDSYWKISKRYCGSGKYYLTIQEINNSKPLFLRDKILIACY